MNRDSGLWPQSLRQSQQILHSKRHAACSRGKTRAGDVNEHRTPAPSHPGPDIMIDFDEEVVESIATPKPVAWFIGRPGDGTIVIPICGLFTPGGSLRNAPGRKQGARAREPIRPPPQSQRTKPAARRPAVALALIRSDAPPPHRNRQDQGSGAQQALRFAPRPRPNRNVTKKYPAHSVHPSGKANSQPPLALVSCHVLRRASVAQPKPPCADWKRH